MKSEPLHKLKRRKNTTPSVPRNGTDDKKKRPGNATKSVLLRLELFNHGAKSRFFPGRSVFMDDFLIAGPIENANRVEEKRLGFRQIFRGDGLDDLFASITNGGPPGTVPFPNDGVLTKSFFCAFGIRHVFSIKNSWERATVTPYINKRCVSSESTSRSSPGTFKHLILKRSR